MVAVSPLLVFGLPIGIAGCLVPGARLLEQRRALDASVLQPLEEAVVLLLSQPAVADIPLHDTLVEK
jgi:hypothetical protein